MKQISIIIPTYNRPNTLLKTIDSYLSQNYVREIIIINDSSDRSYKETIYYIENVCNNNNIKFRYIYNNSNLGAANCRNIGIANATSRYIFWGEDDVFLDKDYLKILFDRRKEKEIVFGSIFYNISQEVSLERQQNKIIEQINKDIELFDYYKFEGYFRKKTIKRIEVPFGHALFLAPKSAYEDISYYEGYKFNGYREESDVQIQMIKSGYKIIYDSLAECYHLPRKEIEKNSGQHKHNLLLYELSKIINNSIFLKRHFKYLKFKFNLNNSLINVLIYYILFIFGDNIKKIKNKIKSKLKENYD